MTELGQQIFSLLEVPLAETVPLEHREYAGELEESLRNFKIESNIKSLYLLPNFQYEWINSPSGWVATFRPNEMFRQHPFISDKFGNFVAVRLKLQTSQITPGFLQAIQTKVSICLPRESLTPPTMMDNRDDSFGCALEDRGGFVGIFRTQIENESERQDLYFACAYVPLPIQFLDELQEHERKLHKATVEFEMSGGNNRSKTPPATFSEEFGPNGVQERAKEISIEHAKRLVYLFSTIIGAGLAVNAYPLDNEAEYRSPLLDPPNPGQLKPALAIWPSDVPITPFSMLPTEPMSCVPPLLRGYRLGQALDILKEHGPKEFELINPNYNKCIVTFTPDVQTVINSFEVYNSSSIHYFSNSAPVNKGPWIVFKGLEFGLDLYNYDPVTRAASFEGDCFNDMGNGFPVMFPCTREHKTISSETNLKFYSAGAGGSLKSNTSADQLQNRFAIGRLSEQGIKKLHPDPQRQKQPLEPVHVFLSAGHTNIATYIF